MTRLWVGIASSLLLAACSQEAPPPQPKTAVSIVTAADTSTGRALAEKSCQACHALDGAILRAGVPILAGQRERFLTTALQAFSEGKRPHLGGSDPAAALTEADRRNVAAFYASVTPRKASASPSNLAEDGKALANRCQQCHGIDGNGNVAGTPSLAGQSPNYFVAAMHEYQNGVRTSGVMMSVASTTDDVVLEKLGLHYAAQAPVRRQQTTSDGDASAGEVLSGRCTGCHGIDGVSRDNSIPSLAGQDAQYLRHAMDLHRSAHGRWGMPEQLASVSARDEADLAAYFAAQAPQRAISGPLSPQAIAEKCDRCHDGEDGAAIPRLKGQEPAYLAIALRAYRDGKRESSAMHNMSAAYGNVLIDAIAAWYARQ
jgi:cytochrome c553